MSKFLKRHFQFGMNPFLIVIIDRGKALQSVLRRCQIGSGLRSPVSSGRRNSPDGRSPRRTLSAHGDSNVQVFYQIQ